MTAKYRGKTMKLTIEYLKRRIEETCYDQGMKCGLNFGSCSGVYEGGKVAAFKEILLLIEEEKVETPSSPIKRGWCEPMPFLIEEE